MKLMDMPEAVTDWSRIPASTMAGASGTVQTRAHQSGDVRLRLVEYGASYLADHWCSKGHIIYVLAGALGIEHEDGACLGRRRTAKARPIACGPRRVPGSSSWIEAQ